MKRVIGITGGVGCGKSTVLSILKDHFGASVFMADDVGHEVFEKDTSTYREIVSHFGDEIIDEKGEIFRGALAEIIFDDEKEKDFLDGIVHPYVIGRIRESIDAWKKRVEEIDKNDFDLHLFILETALLFETRCDKFCDERWGVISDVNQRIERLNSTRGYSEEKSRSIILSQLSDEVIRERCDRIILNNSSKEELEEVVCQMVAELKM